MESGRKISKSERSKHTEVAKSTPSVSAAENTVRAHAKSAAVARCSMTTPLGRPVEPEV